MSTIKEQVSKLSEACFAIEKQLPDFHFISGDPSPKSELRKELYIIRCKIGDLHRIINTVDKIIAEENKDE